MAVDKLAENYLSCLIRDFERPAAPGVDLIFFCYQNGIASIDLQPFVAKFKSEGSVIEPCFGLYALTASGYERYKRCAGKTRLGRMVSKRLSRKGPLLLRDNGQGAATAGQMPALKAVERGSVQLVRAFAQGLLDRFRRSRGAFRAAQKPEGKRSRETWVV
jgi:hypothetical protein